MEKKLNFWYGSIFGTYWMIYAVVCSFASVFLLAKGYNNSQIGMTLAAANILAVIMQPVTADMADRSRRIGSIGISSIMTVMMMVFTLGLFFFRGGGLGICVIFVLLLGWHTVLQPIFNALTFKLEETGIPINFGIARSAGSLAYAIMAAILGTLVENLGVTVIPVASEITCIMLLISLLLTKKNFDRAMKRKGRDRGGDVDPMFAADPEKQAVIDEVPGEEPEVITLTRFISRNRLFFVLNLGVVGLFFSNSILNTFMVQIVTDVGGTSEDMGRILGLMAFLEIPTMVLFSRLKARFSCQLLLKVASVGFIFKILLCWLARSVAMLFAAQAFQLVSFALFFPGMVYFTGEKMSKGEAVKGQALFTTMITLTTIFASLIGGWILDVSGAKTLTLIGTLATVAGAAVIISVVDRIGEKSSKPDRHKI